MIRTLLAGLMAFLAAVASASVLASFFSTQFVLAGLADLGVDIPLGDRAAMTVADFGILPAMAAATGACFAIGFTVAAFLAPRIGGNRTLWFIAAGASAFLTELMIMRAVLGVMPIPGARTVGGLVFQGVAGAAGGWVFARLTRRRAAHGDGHA